MNPKQSQGLYDMTAKVSITPYTGINGFLKDERVQLEVDDVIVGEYATYTEACEVLIRSVNESFD